MTMPPPTPSETILLVDDEPAVRQLVAAALNRAGYRVLEARDGPHGVKIFEDHAGPIHLLVTDLRNAADERSGARGDAAGAGSRAQGSVRVRLPWHGRRSFRHRTLSGQAIHEIGSPQQGPPGAGRSRFLNR